MVTNPGGGSEVDFLRRRVTELEQLLGAGDAPGGDGARGMGVHDFHELVDLAHDGILVRRVDGTILYWNRGAERLYGYEKAEAVGRVSHELLRTTFPKPLEEILAAVLESGYWDGELVHTGRERSVIVASRWVLKRDAEGAPLTLLEINSDITERKAAEQERERQSVLLEQQSRLLDLARDAIIIRDIDGAVTYWNHGAERMYGYLKAEAVGRATHALLRTRFPSELRAINEALVETGHWEGELVHTQRGGATVIVESRWVAQRDEQRRLRHVMEINSDITARKLAEQERERQQQDLIEAQSIALAELSTPLIPITDTVLVMPLIGVVDSRRAEQVIATLLEGISSSSGEIAILDITGVPVVDSEVASAIVRAARAVRLLGAEVVLTGIRADVAQTLVAMGDDLSSVVTLGKLQNGIAYALRRTAKAASRAAPAAAPAPGAPAKS
ncbi:PAS domain S-box protein [Sorangium sp. So ce131]|uniref:PAS domain S-box protein n=1 Tax=Sorangium sp. So ce131 TaxID=3133282 RepID=UPI003F61AEFB